MITITPDLSLIDTMIMISPDLSLTDTMIMISPDLSRIDAWVSIIYLRLSFLSADRKTGSDFVFQL